MSELAAILERARSDLLDLSPANRLLDMPRPRRQEEMVEIVGEAGAEVFRLLVGEEKALGLRPRSGPAPDDAGDGLDGLTPPEEAGRVAARQRGQRLQTGLPPRRLHGRLLRLHDQAHTLHADRGVNALHLALGFLEWQKAGSAAESRVAPLLLVPARLERASARQPFRLAWSGQEIVANPCLTEMLRRDFALELPDPVGVEQAGPAPYLAAIAEAVAAQPRFRLHPDVLALGLFPFARLLLWRDLDPKAWLVARALEERPLLRAVTLDGFRAEPEGLPEETRLDDLLPALDQTHVLDADAWQARAIEEVRQGRNLLIQGPPGTGKSQTIANLIAAAVRDGRRVLFVAGKTAALEVVKRRLDEIGLGQTCLELYGWKSDKRAVLEDLRATVQLGPVQRVDPAPLAARLQAARNQLNAYADALHAPLTSSGLTAQDVLGRLITLERRGALEVTVTLPAAGAWSAAELDERREIVAELARRAAALGTPACHPWRGVRLAAVVPGELARLLQLADRIVRSVVGLRRVVAGLRDSLGCEAAAETPAEVMRLLDTCEYLASAPSGLDATALHKKAWGAEREALARLATAARTLAEARASLTGVVAAEAWSLDLRATRDALARWGRSRWRVLAPAWHRARRRLAHLALLPLPDTLDEQLALLDRLTFAREARAALEEGERLGREAFGDAWRGSEPDWAAIGAIERWEGEGRDSGLLAEAPRLLTRVIEAERLGGLAGQTGLLLGQVEEICHELFTALDLDLQEAFEHSELAQVPLDLVLRRLRAWLAAPEGLEPWIDWRRGAARARSLRLGPLVEALREGVLAPEQALDAFERAVGETLLREAIRCFPVLAGGGPGRDELVERFCELDRGRIRLARAEAAFAHRSGIPRLEGAGGEAGLLHAELAKKRRHRPLRSLLGEAGGVVQALKPVFLMSPLAVAELLPPGAVEFDLLLIDEASRIEPVEALAAIARARQLVVVGDERQLPPGLLLEGGEEATRPGVQSILGLCAAQGMLQRTLRWHHRSRHPSLIAFSNRHLYDQRLIVAPSPMASDPALGIVLHRLAPAAGGREGLSEARAVAEAVIAHARARPDLSLGVGCLTRAQHDAIRVELERLWRELPDVDPFFAPAGAEPFFVRTAEALQGDERDVMLVAIGAPDLGPLAAEGGERWLNVLITRARRRLEVFSALTAADIDPGEPAPPGVAALGAFLDMAAKGRPGERAGEPGEVDPFEREVARALEAQGHQVDLRVDGGDLGLDLAVRDPVRPGRWLLGIQCDGAAWYGALSARDRDRLRRQVLERQGWFIHRLWATEWHRRPEAERSRLEQALAAAREVWAARDRELQGRATRPAAGAAAARPVPAVHRQPTVDAA